MNPAYTSVHRVHATKDLHATNWQRLSNSCEIFHFLKFATLAFAFEAEKIIIVLNFLSILKIHEEPSTRMTTNNGSAWTSILIR